MTIIVDPHKAGCEVWFMDGNIQTLRGSSEENCKRIKNFVIDVRVDCLGKKRPVQVHEVFLDRWGVGGLYATWFDEMGIKWSMVTNKKRIL